MIEIIRYLTLIGLLILLGFRPKAQTVGVIDYTNEVTPGLILFAPVSTGDVYLINECGEMVNMWSIDGKAGLMGRLRSDGSLVYAKRVSSSVFSGGGIGGGLVGQSWDGELLWEIDLANDTFHHHHDLAILPNDNILVNGWEFISVEEANLKGRTGTSPKGLWSEKMIEIDVEPDGQYEIVWEWRLWDHIVQNQDETKDNYGSIDKFPGRLNVNFTNGIANTVQDWLHVNSLDYNEELDQILINSRNLNEFWVIDHSTNKVEAASSSGGLYDKGGDFLYRWGNPVSYKGGTADEFDLYAQHDAHWIDSDFPMGGSIAVFNNGIGRPDGVYSTIDIIHPEIIEGEYQLINNQYAPLTTEQHYGGPQGTDEYFFSSRISGSQSFSNGNMLICIGQDSRFIEINPSKEIVWDYMNPAGLTISEQGEEVGNANNVFQAVKYDYEFIGFEGKDLTAGPKIEINPIDNCDLLLEVDLEHGIGLHVVNTMVRDELIITSDFINKIDVSIYSIEGNLVYNNIHQSDSKLIIPFYEMRPGYYVVLLNVEGRKAITTKIFKLYE